MVSDVDFLLISSSLSNSLNYLNIVFLEHKMRGNLIR